MSTAHRHTEADAPFVVIERDDAIAHLRLNRPARLNSLSMDMLDALGTALSAICADETIKAAVLFGDGRAFCPGHDLKEMNAHRSDPDGGRAFYEALFDRCTEVMLAIRGAPIPIIAAVDGIATAAGCQLAATCDMIIASDRARFGVNGVDSGLFCSTPMVALSRAIPAKAAMEMLVLGELISAERAEMLGLVNRVVTPGALEETALTFARRAAQKARPVVALGKHAFYRQLEEPVDVAYDLMKTVIVDNMMLDDAKEGICAFIEKRTPDWPSDK